jgi:hypothetical protein
MQPAFFIYRFPTCGEGRIPGELDSKFFLPTDGSVRRQPLSLGGSCKAHPSDRRATSYRIYPTPSVPGSKYIKPNVFETARKSQYII